jgi:hypothetical protein
MTLSIPGRRCADMSKNLSQKHVLLRPAANARGCVLGKNLS